MKNLSINNKTVPGFSKSILNFKFRMLNVLIWCLFFGICCLHAQHNSVTSILFKCNEYYKTHPQLSFEMNYKMFDSYTSSNIIQQMNGKYMIKDGMVRIQNGGQTQLMNGKYSIVSDANTETMVIQDKKVENKKRTPLGVDSLIGMFMETKVVDETTEKVILSFNKPKSSFYQISKFTIDFDKQSGKMLKAVLYYAFDLNEFYDEYNTKTIPRIEIVYENYIENEPINNEFFSETNFFRIADNKIVPVNEFKNYRLLDMRN